MRTAIKDFMLVNRVYAGAAVTFYTVSGGVKTAVKATLYAAPTGSATLANPQVLGSAGCLRQAVYIEVPVIATISGLSVADHDTGIINPAPSFRINSTTFLLEYSYDGGSTWQSSGNTLFKHRGAWVTGTAYEPTDTFTSSGTLYYVVTAHTAAALLATDVGAGRVVAVSSLSLPLSVANGGTGSANQAAAFTAIVAPGGTMTGDLHWSSGQIELAPEVSVASAATIDLSALLSNQILITGSTAITSFGTNYAGPVFARFESDGCVITPGASLITPNFASIRAEANDTMLLMPFPSGTGWIVWSYTRHAGRSLLAQAAVGASRKALMSVTAASATGTFTADEIVVSTALGGSQKTLASYSKTINLGTTGAGGMDTGAAPVSGFVSLYAIAKPDGTTSILACNRTTSAGSIYSGANMPSGYLYSALIGIWPTNGSSQFVAGYLLDRKFKYQTAVSIASALTATSLTSRSISSGVPAEARTADVFIGTTSTSTNFLPSVSGDSTGAGAQVAGGAISLGATKVMPAGISNMAAAASFLDVPLITAQTIYWMETGNTTGNAIYVLGYGF